MDSFGLVTPRYFSRVGKSIHRVNYMVDNFLFRIKMIRTSNGHEFQTRLHWHVSDLGIIKPATPRLNGKVEHLARI